MRFRISGLAALSLLFFGACAGPSQGLKTAPANQHINIECLIMDMAGNVLHKVGGSRCVYFPDGSFATGSHKRLAMIGPDGAVRWTRPIDTHHSMNLSLDKTKLLVMSMSLHKKNGRRVRYDKLAIYDLQGNEVHAFDFYDHRAELDKVLAKDQRGKLFPIDYGNSSRHVPEDVVVEYSHANTFAEIPDNASAAKHPAFAKGNFVVNGLWQSVFILSSDLKKILWSRRADRTLHDVKVQANGRFLVYRNDSPPELGPNFSTIDEIDPFTWETRLVYKANPPESFSSRTSGGTQWLENGNLLISDSTEIFGGRVIEVTAEGKIVWSIPYPLIDVRTGKPDFFQRALRLDLSEFLKNHKGI